MFFEQIKELVIAIFLGALQGVTEFLPISSTAHLGVASQLLANGDDLGIYATNLISLGTTFAVIQYFWKDIVGFIQNWKNLRQWIEIGLATLPIVLASLVFADVVDSTLRTLFFFGVFLIAGALILALAEWYHAQKERYGTTLSYVDYTLVGLFQALAIFPGMSRSGSTLAGGLFLGKDRASVVRASFWLSVPAFILAGIYSLYELLKSPVPPQIINTVTIVSNLSWVSILAGGIAAYFMGIYALRWLIPFLQKYSSKLFIIYRIAVGLLLIGFSLLQ